ncbi:MAG: glycosyltransferase family 4 protein [Planctomycetota bacterium]
MIVLIEPVRAPGFVSGGYRYQAEIMRRLATQGLGELRAVAPGELATAVATAQRERPDAKIVIDGLFASQQRLLLPRATIALLHGVPEHEPWCEVPLPVIATSQTTASAVRGVARSIAVVRPGLDACFVPGPARAAAPRIRVVCVGTVSPDKGQHRIATALARPDLAARCELVLVGNTSCHPDYTAAVRGAAGPLPLHVLGAVPASSVAAELHAADLFVSASRRESFGMATAEAAACGVPVLAFHTGEIDTFVWTGHNGWLVPADADDTTFARQIVELAATPALLEVARARARRPALLDWDAVAKLFADACRTAAFD